MATRPTGYIEWCPDGSPTKIVKPPSSLSDAGYMPGQVPAAQHFNWLMHTADQWIQYLDELASGIVVAPTQPRYTPNNIRLAGGGYWSAGEVATPVATGAVTLTWAQDFRIAMPGVAQSANAVASGSVDLLERQVAWVDVNVPAITTGDITSGSNVITDVADTSDIVVGMAAAGPGIPQPAGLTVSAKTSTTVTLSGNATLTVGGAQLSFTEPTALTVNVGDQATFEPQWNSVVIATRREFEQDLSMGGFHSANGNPSVAPVIVVGANCEQMVLRPYEWRTLDAPGYEMAVLAQCADGAQVNRGTVVRQTVNNPVTVALATSNVPSSAAPLGLLTQDIKGVTSGGLDAYSIVGWVACRGIVKGVVTGMSSRVQYYLGNGALTTTAPTASGTAVVPMGVSLTTDTILINPSGIVFVNP